jgi:hypothetical protein
LLIRIPRALQCFYEAIYSFSPVNHEGMLSTLYVHVHDVYSV